VTPFITFLSKGRNNFFPLQKILSTAGGERDSNTSNSAVSWYSEQ